MPRPTFALPLVLLLASACADDSTAMTDAGPATDPTESTTPGTDPGSTTMAITLDPTATTTANTLTTADTTTGPDPTTANTTTTDPTDTTTDTTGEPGVCGVDGDSVSAELVHDDQPAPCAPLEFTGTRLSPEKGPKWQLDGCPCDTTCLVPDPWSLSVTTPAPWLPLIPECPRIVVERAMGFAGCEFIAMSVWDLEAPGAPAVYHAGHGFEPTQPAAGELTVTPKSVETCACMGCCDTSELWQLEFELQGDFLSLAEGESGPLGERNAVNFESHRIGLCDAPLDVHWVIRKPA